MVSISRTGSVIRLTVSGTRSGLSWRPCAGTSPNCAVSNPRRRAEEIEAAARQYVRKVSGITRPTAANADAFEAAVAEVTATTTRLLAALPPRRQPPKTVPPLRRPEVRARLAAM